MDGLDSLKPYLTIVVRKVDIGQAWRLHYVAEFSVDEINKDGYNDPK